MVMGGDLSLKCREFESQCCIIEVSHLLVVKTVLVFEKD